jgi:hypothetical protein
MDRTNTIELWNLVGGVPAKVGSQKIFNVVGCLKDATQIDKLFYSLNGKPEKLVFFNSLTNVSERMENLGDFNIDTIELEDLQPNNTLVIKALDRDSNATTYQVDFPISWFTEKSPNFKLNLERIDYPQQVGQVLEGKWSIGRDDRTGEPFLEVRPEDAGYDKIMLFGRYDWTHGYEIKARFCVTSILEDNHNCGVFFKFNPHLQGGGTCLPTNWSTGLAYYSSLSKGMRIRFGVNVYRDEQRKLHGSYILDEQILNLPLYWKGKIIRGIRRRLARINPNLGEVKKPMSQIVPGRQYCLKMIVDPDRYSFTVWQHGTKEPLPQAVAIKPIDRLPQGSVGIGAYQCSLRLYEYSVSPITGSRE